MESYIDLKKLTLEELVGVVNIYPWFSLARKELCERMCKLGDWGMSQYAEAAMYMSDRRVLSRLLRSVAAQDYSDANVSEVVSKMVSPAAEQVSPLQQRPRVVVVGGDYFSQAEYDRVRRGEDADFSSYASTARPAASGEPQGPEYEFCTETLAQIYAEQGYYEQAKNIYSKLILAYPEKSVYFAALIEQLNQISEQEN